MEKNNFPKGNRDEPKGRLNNPALRLASILLVLAAISVLIYSLANSFTIFSIMAGAFFLMLWFLPQLWDWIEFVFSKRPSSTLGRLAMNLVIAIIIASIIEDVSELIIKIIGIILRFIG